MSRPIAVPPVTMAAHFLTSAGSELARASELLELAGWSDAHLLERLRGARELVQGIRLLVDARVQEALYLHRGEPVPEHVRQSVELGEALVSP